MSRFGFAAVLFFLTLLAPGLAVAVVDINTANESQLEALPGIGPKKAREILGDRQANGPFSSVEDLRRVKGIGDKTIADLRAQVTAGSASTAVPATMPGKSAGSAVSLEGGLPLGWVVLAVVAAGGIGWFVLRRRSADTSGPASAPNGASATARQVPAAAPTQSAPVPKPAGPKPAAASAPQPASNSASTPPPAPAGPKRKDG